MNRRLGKGIIAFLGMVVLILDSKTAISSAAEAIELCLNTVIPSLYPFFVLSNILVDVLYGMKSSVLTLFAKIFRIPEKIGGLTVCAFLGGYPIGAQCIGQLYEDGILPKKSAEKMLAFCSNAGPAFIFGVTPLLFEANWIPWLIWGVHILGAYFVSLWISCDNAEMPIADRKEKSLPESVICSINTMGKVCGWIVFFKIIIEFMDKWFLWIHPVPIQIIISGMIELTNGCMMLTAIEDLAFRTILYSGILSFGGLCVAMQTESVTSDLSLKYYIFGKTAQAIISMGLCFCVFYFGIITTVAGCICLHLTWAYLQKNVAFPVKVMYNVGNDSWRDNNALS